MFFAVCIECGCQSPPVFEDLRPALQKMGWKLNEESFSVRAICPQCQVKQ
jgi:Fe2+ or Zn2+ uptake regulation protein